METIEEKRPRGRPRKNITPKEKLPRGRPRKIIAPKEKLPHGRPRKIVIPKEKLPRGRPRTRNMIKKSPYRYKVTFNGEEKICKTTKDIQEFTNLSYGQIARVKYGLLMSDIHSNLKIDKINRHEYLISNTETKDESIIEHPIPIKTNILDCLLNV